MVINSVVRIFILLLSRFEENLGEIFLLFLFSLIIDFSFKNSLVFSREISWFDWQWAAAVSWRQLLSFFLGADWLVWMRGCVIRWLRAVSSQCFRYVSWKTKTKCQLYLCNGVGKDIFACQENYLNAHRQIYLVISKISDQTNLNIQIFSPYFSRIQTNEIHFQRSSTNRRHTYQFKK